MKPEQKRIFVISTVIIVGILLYAAVFLYAGAYFSCKDGGGTIVDYRCVGFDHYKVEHCQAPGLEDRISAPSIPYFLNNT